MEEEEGQANSRVRGTNEAIRACKRDGKRSGQFRQLNNRLEAEPGCLGLLNVQYQLSTVAQKGQTQINIPKHKPIFHNTNQYSKTQINVSKHKSIF